MPCFFFKSLKQFQLLLRQLSDPLRLVLELVPYLIVLSLGNHGLAFLLKEEVLLSDSIALLLSLIEHAPEPPGLLAPFVSDLLSLLDAFLVGDVPVLDLQDALAHDLVLPVDPLGLSDKGAKDDLLVV